MKPVNKQFLDDNRHHHTTLVKAFYLRSLSGATRETMQRVMSEEFQTGYATDLWCPPCVSDMVLALYRNYDNWIASQPAIVIEPEVVIPEPGTNVILEKPEGLKPEPIIVAASFPSNLPGVNPENVIPSAPQIVKENNSTPLKKKRR
jgi:hypothetical protein